MVCAVSLSSSRPSCRTGICQSSEYFPREACFDNFSEIFDSLFSLFQFSQLEPVLSSGVQSFGEGYKAERWLLHSLQGHILSAQLKPLLQHKTNTQKYYNGNSTSSKPLASSLTYTVFLCVIMLLVVLFCRHGLPVE